MTERTRPSESSCGDPPMVMAVMPPARSPRRSSRPHPREREHKHHPQRWTRPTVSGKAACARQRCANMLTEATGICGISNANSIKDRTQAVGTAVVPSPTVPHASSRTRHQATVVSSRGKSKPAVGHSRAYLRLAIAISAKANGVSGCRTSPTSAPCAGQNCQTSAGNDRDELLSGGTKKLRLEDQGERTSRNKHSLHPSR